MEEEVKSYLDLANIQSRKAKPAPAIIKSNLKNAAVILDDYITRTLNKPSKVVTNWVDALLLQSVDYKAEIKESAKQEIHANENLQENPVDEIPQNVQPIQEQAISKTQEPVVQATQPHEPKESVKLASIKLKKVYRETEKLIDKGEYDKALANYEKALKIAQKLDDKNIATKIYMDVAYIHDVNNDLPQALENYNNAANFAEQIGDKTTQAKAHYNMATIYDDTGKIDLALDHYYAALALDGDAENVQGQALTLNSIGNMFSVKNEYKEALNYYKLAFGLAKDQNDNLGKAVILNNVAGVFKDLGYDKKALKYYQDAVKCDKLAGNFAGCAKTFEQAGDIMLRNGNAEKAKALYKKSMLVAQQMGDRAWTSRMNEKITAA